MPVMCGPRFVIVSFTSLSSVRVVLLEDIHTMRAEAANSLLKTLEEPPDNNLLIGVIIGNGGHTSTSTLSNNSFNITNAQEIGRAHV